MSIIFIFLSRLILQLAERSMINARTRAGIVRAKQEWVKFGRTLGSFNKTTQAKHEKIKIFLKGGKSYAWIAKELSVIKKIVYSY